jgi:uncharacterized iron-regulated membrane protein
VKKLLYQIHRWAGIALALFMFVWFSSGLVIMYAGPSALSPDQQLAHREALAPQTGWLSLGEAWTRSGQAKPGRSIAEARLVRQADQPLWLVEDNHGHALALSAQDGAMHRTSVSEGARIAARWVTRDLADEGPIDAAKTPAIRHIDTGPQDSSVRNQEALRPFHRFAVGDSSRELLVSVKTGEVVRDSTNFTRALYWVGNWIHLLRPIEAISNAATRRTTLTVLAVFAVAASLTGLVIGWQRWRPGWGGRATYSQGRVHPYRDVWNTWHFWVGLIGGTAALLWAFSGLMNSNPGQVFSPANASHKELSRYQGAQTPQTMLDWQPVATVGQSRQADIVELAWHRVGEQTTLLAVDRDGERVAQSVPGTVARFGDAQLLQAASRLIDQAKVTSHALQTEYDSYYYPRHHQSTIERPLPVLRIDLADAGSTRLYVDPQDGRVLLKQDASRRAYRWLYSAIHHWDFGWLYQRPVWDAWMLPLVLMGVVLGGTSIVLGWKRLQMEFKPKKKKKKAPAKAPVGQSLTSNPNLTTNAKRPTAT